MKKLFLTLLGIVCSIGMWAADVTFGVNRSYDSTDGIAAWATSSTSDKITLTDLAVKGGDLDFYTGTDKTVNIGSTSYAVKTAPVMVMKMCATNGTYNGYVGYSFTIAQGYKVTLSSFAGLVAHGGGTQNFKIELYKSDGTLVQAIDEKTGATGSWETSKTLTNVLNEGTYQLRLYAAKTAGGNKYDTPVKLQFTGSISTVSSTKHSVTYSLGEGTGTAPTQDDVAEGSVFTVAASTGITAPTGKVFVAWNDGTNDYNPGVTYTMGTSDVTLTAQFADAYTVSFDANGGTGTMSSLSYVAGATVTAPECTFTGANGAVFDGWTVTGVDGTEKIAAGETFTMPANAVTLTASWTNTITVIKAVLNGGTNTPTVTGTYAGSAEAKTQSDKKFGSGSYVGLTLADGYKFKKGDILNVHITTACSGGGAYIKLYTDKEGTTVIYNTETVGAVGDNKFELPAAIADYGTFYICRTSDNGWNAYVDYIEVTREQSTTKSNECKLTKLVLSNGFNTAIVGDNITGYYMSGTDTPTIQSATVSEGATYVLDGTTLTVTAEDETTTKEYTLSLTSVEPLTSTDEQSVTSETPSWLKFGVWNAGKSAHEIYKAVDEASNMRITEGKNRAYLFVGPCDKVILTNGSSSENTDRDGTYSVNGAAATNVTFPKYNNGAATIEIPCSNSSNNMIEIVNTTTGGSWGFTSVKLANVEYYSVTYSLGESGATGILPANIENTDVANKYQPTASNSIYKAGYTMKGWTDGENNYLIGQPYTMSVGAHTLTPYLVANTVDLTDLTAAKTVTWKFGKSNSAPTFDGSARNYVQQVSLNGTTTDLAIVMGGGSNSGRTDEWMNNQQKNQTVPVCAGAVVKAKVYYASNAVFNGETITYNESQHGAQGNVVFTYTCPAGVGSTIDVNVGNQFLSYIEVTYPKCEKKAVAINQSGISSCVTNVPLDFTDVDGIKAYVAEALPSNGSTTLRLTRVKKVSAGAYFVKGTASTTYDVPVLVGKAETYTNMIKGSTTETTSTSGKTIYALSKTYGDLRQVSSAITEIPVNVAFLDLTGNQAKSISLTFDDDTTTAVEAVVETTDRKTTGRFVNLAGQPVGKNYKGIVIDENGKKFINK